MVKLFSSHLPLKASIALCCLYSPLTWTCCLQGYEVHVYESVTNQTSFLGNTTETYFRISSLLLGHNYTFSVQARCLLSGQLCGEPALLLYNQLAAGTHTLTSLLTSRRTSTCNDKTGNVNWRQAETITISWSWSILDCREYPHKSHLKSWLVCSQGR